MEVTNASVGVLIPGSAAVEAKSAVIEDVMSYEAAEGS
jgi:hypothetical protein